MNRRRVLGAMLGCLPLGGIAGSRTEAQPSRKERRFLYVASPGIRNYLEYGGVGLLVYDIDAGHQFVRRIPTLSENTGQPAENVKGICASARTGKIYVSTIKRLLSLDLNTERLLWNREYEGGCDRMSITPDGKVIYLPSLEGPFWNVVDAQTGDVLRKVVTDSGAHNTIIGLRGKRAYLAGLKSPYLFVTDTRSHRIVQKVGPFSQSIRPFTVNGEETLCFVNVNDLLGFEVGDLTTGKRLHRVEVRDYRRGPVKRHGCPSHGIGLTPDETELWLTDAHNTSLHVFDATVMPPRQIASIKLVDQPGWVTFSLDGRYAYPSTGEVIDVRSKMIVATLKDEHGRHVQSEKVQEILFADGKPARNADQFGLGRRR